MLFNPSHSGFVVSWARDLQAAGIEAKQMSINSSALPSSFFCHI